jgi:hypothetical protein
LNSKRSVRPPPVASASRRVREWSRCYLPTPKIACAPRKAVRIHGTRAGAEQLSEATALPKVGAEVFTSSALQAWCSFAATRRTCLG